MRYILFLLLIITSAATAQVPQYAPDRSKGQVVVTDVALRTKEFLQLPTANTANPTLGSYPDSNGRVWFNVLDSNLTVRRNGSYIRYFNSTRINNIDASTVHLAGTETITGNKTFNGNNIYNGTTTVATDISWSNNTGFGLRGQDGVRYLYYTTASGAFMPNLRIAGLTVRPGNPIFTVQGKSYFTDSINIGTGMGVTNDIIWLNNSGFGLRGNDAVRFLYYTTATGAFMPTLRIAGTTIQNGNPQFTVQGKGWVTDTLRGGTIARVSGTSTQYLMADGSVRTNVTGSIDTGRSVSQIVTGGSLNKVRDSITSLFASGTYTPTLTGVSNVSSTTSTLCQYMRVGNTVTISGKVRVTGTTAGTTATISITLPIAQNNFANSYEAAGSGGFIASNIYYGATLSSNSGAQTISLSYIPTAFGDDEIYFTVTYQIK